jgi:integrase
MILLPNGCKCGKMSVFPKNWNTRDADLSITWYIKYRFYSPAKKPYPVVIKGFAQYETLADRRQAVKEMIAGEKEQLQNGYNPAEKKFAAPAVCDATEGEISTSTGFIPALQKALDILDCTDETRIDIKCVLKYVAISAQRLGLYYTAISTIKSKHIKLILNDCKNHIVVNKQGEKRKKVWNANQYNHYLKYLGLLFTELLEWGAVEAHPIQKAIKKKPTVKKIREVLTDEECKAIDRHLFNNYYTFWRLMQIFFYSGAREKEMLALQKKDVNLTTQLFIVTIHKGKESRQVEKPIHNEVLELWKEIVTLAKPGQYLFSESLMPGNKIIRREQITRRWKTHVKDKLKINADFYSLKHLYLDKVAAQLGIESAQKAASHTTPVITMTYAVNEKNRQQDALKTVPVKFGK